MRKLIITPDKLSKESGVEVKDKVAPGIGYEKMQILNLDDHMNEMLGVSGHKALPLFINGKDTGIDIDGGAKVKGSPKADLAFGIKGKPNFFVSYKHGDYVDSNGKELPASYQQYGSLKTFYTKDFNYIEWQDINNDRDVVQTELYVMSDSRMENLMVKEHSLFLMERIM